jgi:hypothetical protein
MPKPYTFPTIYNEALQIDIAKLKSWGYLRPGQITTGTVSWSRNDNHRGSISIKGNTVSEQPYIELDYNFQDEPRNYKIYLTSTPSNLKKGKIWYFLCPQTNKRCRKLYSIGGYFLHREAFKGCMYETQTYSKKNRDIFKLLGGLNDKLYRELNKKHFKKSYAGKPTKKYLKLINQINKTENIPFETIKKAIFGKNFK